MKLEQIRTIAKSRGVHPGKLTKANLIKSIQIAEGNADCFAGTHSSTCDQVDCLWREDCFETAQKGELS